MRHRESPLKITQARLKEMLAYDPATGLFTRLQDAGGHKAGTIAGSMSPKGYVHICIDSVVYRGHQLAWLYVTGAWPEDTVDHRNRVRSDNRWQNLRAASMAQQAWNRSSVRGDDTMMGVSKRPGSRRWYARIKSGGKVQNLGGFDTPQAAHAAYVQAKAEYERAA